VSWWSPSTDWTFFICLANFRAGLPQTGAAASAAYRARLAALRAECRPMSLVGPGASAAAARMRRAALRKPRRTADLNTFFARRRASGPSLGPVITVSSDASSAA
jgi:hypothetical protein